MPPKHKAMVVTKDLAGGQEQARTDPLGEREWQDAVFHLTGEQISVSVSSEVVTAHQTFTAHEGEHVKRRRTLGKLPIKLCSQDGVFPNGSINSIIDDVSGEVTPVADA